MTIIEEWVINGIKSGRISRHEGEDELRIAYGKKLPDALKFTEKMISDLRNIRLSVAETEAIRLGRYTQDTTLPDRF
jgi:hypothetical protein